MPDRIVLREDIQAVLLESFGNVTLEDVTDAFGQAISASQESGFSNVVVDLRNTESMPSMANAYHFGARLAKEAPGIRFAVVTLPDKLHDADFVELVATNRGGLFKVFHTIEEAIAWLSEVNKETASHGE